jgi:CheY-like chemotaxis protein
MQNILIIDDDEEDCDLLADAVKTVDSSIDCVKVYSCKEALELLSTDYKPNYIFLDLNMPICDGKTCLLEIRKNKSKNKIPVIIYTTSNRKIDIEEAHDRGAVYVITKPTALKELCDEILFVLDKGWEKYHPSPV